MSSSRSVSCQVRPISDDLVLAWLSDQCRNSFLHRANTQLAFQATRGQKIQNFESWASGR